MDCGSFAQMQRRSRVTNISQLIDHIVSLPGRIGPRDAEKSGRARGPVVAAMERGETLCGYNASEIWAESSSPDKLFHCWSNDVGYSIGGLATKTKSHIFYWLLSPGASSRSTFIMRRKNLSVKDSVRSNSSSLGIPDEPFGCAVGASDNLLLNSAFSRLSRETSASRAAFSSALARQSDSPSLTVQKDTDPACVSRRRKPPSVGVHRIAPRLACGRRLVFRTRRGGERQGAAKKAARKNKKSAHPTSFLRPATL